MAKKRSPEKGGLFLFAIATSSNRTHKVLYCQYWFPSHSCHTTFPDFYLDIQNI
ncbi:MAG: hypothetical protein ABI358_09035 [Ginsengibacter sp.]